jgi:hypothetical protein
LIIQFLYFDESYLPELEYLCRLFSSIIGETIVPCHVSKFNKEGACSIGYSSREAASHLPESCRIRIHSDDLFWKQYLKKKCPEVLMREHSGLLALNSEDSKAFVIKDTSGISTNLDLFSSAFFMITGMEEVTNPHLRDEYQRFTFSRSKWAHVYVNKPRINSYAQTLLKWIEEIYDLSIPSKGQFTAVLTHDIDSPYFYGRLRTELSEIYNGVIARGKYARFSDLVNYLACLLGMQSDPHDTFFYMQEHEGKRGISATYFINLSKDSTWGLDWEKYSRTLKKIHGDGNEIALHPGFNSYSDREMILHERNGVEALSGATINGARNHFLRFKNPECYYALSSLGLSYDATVGYPDREGFKAGICTPYKPFDIQRREQIDIMEIPLVVMDGTLHNYRKQSPETAQSTIETLIEHVSSCAGVITFDWHNSFLIEKKGEWRNVYEKSLDSSIAHHARFLTCGQLASLWRERWSY